MASVCHVHKAQVPMANDSASLSLSGNSICFLVFVSNQEDQSSGPSTGKLSWQNVANSYSLRRGIAHTSKVLHGTAHNLYHINQSFTNHTASDTKKDESASGTQTNAAINQSSSQFYLPGTYLNCFNLLWCWITLSEWSRCLLIVWNLQGRSFQRVFQPSLGNILF